MTDKTLLQDFEPMTYAAWKTAVEADLKGVPFDKKLLSRTFENIVLKPLYTESDLPDADALRSWPGLPPYLRGSAATGYNARTWEISQELDFASAAEFNDAARNSVERGLTALNIVLDQATRNGNDPDWAGAGDVGVGGLSVATLEDLDRALAGIDLEKISLFIRSGSSAMPLAALWIALVRKRRQNPALLRGCMEMDPLGVLSHEGRLPHSLEGAYREMAQLTRWASVQAPQLQTICVHTRAWHESGGTAVQELAFGLSTGVDYVRQLAQRGLSIQTVAPRMRFAVTVGSRLFMEIAKLRAARLLWSRAVEAMGGDSAAQRMHLHVRTSQRNKTVYDPHVNLLRSTVESFAAVLGGCDSLQVGAFDETFRTPDDFSRRLARNTQLILAKECDLTRFVDPSGGSWYLERLTFDLAEQAWTQFQQVEKLGGMAAALKKGFPQEQIALAAQAKRQSLAERKTVLIGTSKYANPSEQRLPVTPFDVAAFQKKRRQQVIAYRTQSEDERNQSVLQRLAQIVETADASVFDACVEAVSVGASLGEVTRSIRISDNAAAPIEPVILERAAKPFEQLRARVEKAAAQQGAVPSVFLATMGPGAQFRARADFAKAFFEVAGMNVIYPRGFATPDLAIQAAVESHARWVVLCSTDDTYPELVPVLTARLHAAMPGVLVVVAGYPTEHIAAFKQAGVDGFIHLKSDVIQTLNDFLSKGGVSHVS